MPETMTVFESMLVKVNEILSLLPAVLLTFGGKILVALAIFIIGKWIAKMVANLVQKAMVRGKVDATVAQYVQSITYGALLIFVIIAAIARLGVQTTSFVAIFGAATLAIGMALQGTLGNFSSGVMLLIFRPFKVGDSVIAGGVEGRILDIGIFATTIVPPDGRKVSVPNGALVNGTITNFNSLPTRVVEMSIEIPDTMELSTTEAGLISAAKGVNGILSDPAPKAIITAVSPAGTTLRLVANVKSSEYDEVLPIFLKTMKATLKEKGIWA